MLSTHHLIPQKIVNSNRAYQAATKPTPPPLLFPLAYVLEPPTNDRTGGNMAEVGNVYCPDTAGGLAAIGTIANVHARGQTSHRLV